MNYTALVEISRGPLKLDGNSLLIKADKIFQCTLKKISQTVVEIIRYFPWRRFLLKLRTMNG